MNQSSLYTPVVAELQEVELLMRHQADGYHDSLIKALDMIFSAGGKRLRATTNLLIGKMLHADRSHNIIMASAIELLHTATLVHDDFIDGSMLRRGNPTLNSMWTSGPTILAGDFMFARAARLVTDTECIQVVKDFSQTLGIIVNGEVSQMFARNYQPDRNSYYQRIYAKTASLFEMSAKTASILGNADSETVENMTHYGYNLGMAYQIMDDILDFSGEQETMGKPVGNDLRQGLITLPSIYYIEHNPHNPLVSNMIINGKLESDQQVKELIQNIVDSEALIYSHQVAEEYIQKSLVNLKTQAPSEYRDSLESLALYVLARNV